MHLCPQGEESPPSLPWNKTWTDHTCGESRVNGETPTLKAPGTCGGQAGALPVMGGKQAWMKFRSPVDTAHISTTDPELRAELETSNT